VIADRHPVHRSRAVRAWRAENTERIELHLMPGYSPELNPDELLSADLTHHVHAARATCICDPTRETCNFLHWSRQSDLRVLRHRHAPVCQDRTEDAA
jgi:hypothetical protein